MAKAKAEKSEGKEYSLKPIEMQMIKVLQDSYFTELSNFLSFIALERLAYQVTKNTRFAVDDGKVLITENVEEAQEVEAST